MAVATATAVAIGGLALSAAGTAGNFIQAGKQRREQAKAQEEAAKALADAKKELMINYYKGLGIRKGPYELERMAMLAAGAQAIQAGQESERGAEATSGRVQMAQQEQQAGIRTAMGKELQDLDYATAEESAKLAGKRAEISLEEAKGSEEMAAAMAEAAGRSMTQGFQGVQSMAQQAQALIPLYQGQNAEPNRADSSTFAPSPLASRAPSMPTAALPPTQPAPPPVTQIQNPFDVNNPYYVPSGTARKGGNYGGSYK